MARYEYRCPRDGGFELTFPVGTAPASLCCSECGSEAVRVFSVPMLVRMPRPLVAAIDRASRSADSPEVVSSLPPRPRARRPPAGPAHTRLPRP
jgi:hypothetical protein